MELNGFQIKGSDLMRSKIKMLIAVIVLLITALLTVITFSSVKKETVNKKSDVIAVSISELFRGKDSYKEILNENNAKYMSDNFINEFNLLIEEIKSKDDVINLSEIKRSREDTEEDIVGPGFADESDELSIDYSGILGYEEPVEENDESEENEESEENLQITEDIQTVEENQQEDQTDEEIEERIIAAPFVGVSITENDQLDAEEVIEDSVKEEYQPKQIPQNENVFEVNGEFLIYKSDIEWKADGTATIFFNNENIILFKSDIEPTYNEMTESLSYTFIDYTLTTKDDYRYYTFISADKANILSIQTKLSDGKLHHISMSIDKVRK